MAINFDALPKDKPAAGGTVPKGQYLAVIEKAEMKTPKDETKPNYLNLFLALSNPVDNVPVGKVWDILTETDAPLPQYKLHRFITALKLPITGNFDLKDLTKMVVGKSMLVDIKIDEKSSPERSVVDALSAQIYYAVDEEKKAPEETPPFEEETNY